MKNENTIVAAEGRPFIAVAALILLVMLVFHAPWWATTVWAALTIFVVAFFRNPHRVVPPGADAIVSPADGEVIAVAEFDDMRFGMGRCKRLSIFMSPFNVHVNRVPLTAKVLDVQYRPGRFLVASAEKASLDNEQCAVIAETPGGRRFVFVQIAGMMARRIVTYARPGDQLVKGMRYGLIRFGSRVDLYLPLSAEIEVRPGDRVRGAATRIGRLSDAS
jgi:phosphatidylserine decarboxylase